MSKFINIKAASCYVVLVIGGVIVAFPAIWGVLTSLKPYSEMFRIPIKILPSHPTFEHYVTLFFMLPVPRLIANSFIITGVITLSSFFFATMIGYGLAKYPALGMNIIFIMILSSIMVPPFIRIIPLYVMMVKLGGESTYWGVILPLYVSTFGMFLIRQYAVTIPDELLDSARLDGASEPRILWSIAFPLLKPACMTLIVLKFLSTWNMLLWPLVMLSKPKMMTFAVALAGLKGALISHYGSFLAGAVILILPVLILFLFLQRYIIRGIALTGFK